MQPDRLPKSTLPLAVAAALSACLSIWAPSASAAGREDKFSDADANGSWNDGGNWEHSVPIETETVCIPLGIPEGEDRPSGHPVCAR